MPKIKLQIHRNKQQSPAKTPAVSLGTKHWFSWGTIGLLVLFMVSTAAAGFPQKALAAGGVTITDKITFPGAVPSSVTATQDIVAITSSANGYAGFGDSSAMKISGNTAIFTIKLSSVQGNGGQAVSPIPAGTYTVVSIGGFGSGSSGSSDKGSVQVNSSGSGSTTINGTSCGNALCTLSFGQGIGNAAAATEAICGANQGTSGCVNQIQNLGAACLGAQTASNGSACQTGPNTTSNSGPTCESGGNTLDWIFCGIYDGASKASTWLLTNIIMPELNTSPLCVSATGSNCLKNDPTYAIWSNFRIYGDVFLIIALLVVVFGESLGGGMIDAYTAKKILPRLLGAAILINLSIYIVAGLVDLTNIVGSGIGEILTAPLKGAGTFSIKPSGVGVSEVAGGLLVGGVLGAGHLAGLWSTSGMSMIIDVIVIPAALVFLSILVTIIIRKAAILLLVFVAPIAFALYCLPNTEKYFKKWWSVLSEVLMVYPIIVAIFAIADIMSVTVEQPAAANGVAATATSGINFILSFAFLIIPLFLIPFSFKLAGDTIGRLHDAVSQGRQKVSEMNQGRRERSLHNFKTANLQARQNRYAAMQKNASKGGAFRRNTLGRGVGLLARGYGGYNIEAETSAQRAAVGKQLNDQIATGDDKEIRALTVNKAWARRHGTEGVDYRKNEKTGEMEYKTLGGAWASESSVNAAYRRWGNDTFAQQTALSYEMRKAATEEEAQGITDRYKNIATGAGGWGMSDQQAGGAWIGAAFEHQNDHLEYKHTDWKSGQLDGEKFVNETYEKKGSYAMSQNGSNTIKKLQEVYASGDASEDTRQKIEGIAEQFVHDVGAGGYQQTGEDGEAPIMEPLPGMPPAPGQAGRQRERQVSSQGAGHFTERVRELAKQTGRLEGQPTGQYTNPTENPQGKYRDGSTIPGNPREPGPMGNSREQK